MKTQNNSSAVVAADRNPLVSALIQAIEHAGFSVSGPTDSRAAEDGEPIWVCNARAAIAEYASEIESLRKALIQGRDWGIRSRGYSAEQSYNLAAWVDAGMVGSPPPIPDYYPKTTEEQLVREALEHAVLVQDLRKALGPDITLHAINGVPVATP